MDEKLLAKQMNEFAALAESILVQISGEDFDAMNKQWREFFEECANVIDAYGNLPLERYGDL